MAESHSTSPVDNLGCGGKPNVEDHSQLGDAFRHSRTRLGLAILFAVALVGFDSIWLWRGGTVHDPERYVPLLALLVCPALADGHRPSVGLRLRPIQGWSWWLKIFGLCCVGAALVVAVHVGLRALGYNPMQLETRSPQFARKYGFMLCIETPVIEELLYRLALCAPAAACFGRWWAIVISWGLFASAHAVGGAAGVDNLVLGLLFAWAFVKSESLVIPIVLHSLYNAAGLLCMMLA